MKLRFTEKTDRDYAGLPIIIRKAFGKQLRFLLANRAHPTLCTCRKNTAKRSTLWQGRVTRDWRFYFKIEGDEYVILSIIPHPK